MTLGTLDFSALDDALLVELFRAVCEEIRRRGAAVIAEAERVYVDQTERARIQRTAAEQEVERLRKREEEKIAREAAEQVRQAAEQRKVVAAAAAEAELWARRKGVALALKAAGWDCKGDQLVVWMRNGTKEKRVFLQQLGYGGATYATLYVTGNGRHAPDTAEYATNVFGGKLELKKKVGDVLRAVAREWNAFKVDLGQALAVPGEGIAPKFLVAAQAPAEAPAATVADAASTTA